MKVALIGGGSRCARAFMALSERAASDIEWLSFVRCPGRGGDSAPTFVVADYRAITPDMLRGCDSVVNFVGTIKASNEAEYLKVNAELPKWLATAAKAAGVAQFIQLSSLSVYGRAPRVNDRTPLAPVTAYGRSKLAADQSLAPMGDASFHITLLRIPIVYGAGAPSKLHRLADLLRHVRFLPVPRLLPHRSIISYNNLSLVLLDLLRTPRQGVVFAADPQPFQLDIFANVLPFGVRVVPLPSAMFAPLRWVAPSLHASLFAPLEIAPECLLHPAEKPLVETEISLRAAFGTRVVSEVVTGSDDLR